MKEMKNYFDFREVDRCWICLPPCSGRRRGPDVGCLNVFDPDSVEECDRALRAFINSLAVTDFKKSGRVAG